jgi:hypothetical protein
VASVSSKQAWTIAGLLGGMWVFGMWAYVTHGHDEFFDPGLARKANSICTEAKAELAQLPRLPEAPTFDQRAESVERTIPVFNDMLTRLRALATPGENRDYDRWIERWRDLIEVAQPYADAIRTGDPARYEPAGDVGDRPARELNAIARANDMDACIF